MPLSLQEVEHIANLARLELTDDEKNHYREQLSAILEYVAQLQKLNTTSTICSAHRPESLITARCSLGTGNRSEPTGGVFSAENPLRADEPRPGLTPEALLKTAAQKERSQFKIPPVFE